MPILKNNIELKQLKKHWLLAGAFLVLLVIGAKIDLDFGGLVSFTLQTLFLGIAYYCLPQVFRLILIASYLFLGIVGVPVFNGGVGLDYLLSFPLGFFVGFVVAAFLPGPVKATYFSIFFYLVVFHVLILSLGTIWLWYYSGISVAADHVAGLSLGMIIKSSVGALLIWIIHSFVRPK